MITIDLTQEDLAKIRFAYSPLVELAYSYRLLLAPSRQALYRRWVDEVQGALYGVELPYMDALVQAKGYIPDFMTPTPKTSHFNIEKEIEQMMATPDEVVRKNVRIVIDQAGASEMRQYYLAYPREMLLCLADEMRLYWQRALLPHWSHINSVIEGDILYRARVLATEGADRLLADLDPMMTYEPGQIQMHKAHHQGEFQLNGSGIQLVPSVFRCIGPSYQIVPEWHPMLVYAARGIGQWHQVEDTTTNPNQSLELALGVGRAKVLQMLTTPANTGELARQLQLSAGAVSQQLDRLNQAGLVEPHRSGKRVFYHLTQRGQKLLALFDGQVE